MCRKSQKLSQRKKLLLTVKDTLMQHAATVVRVLKLPCAFKTVFNANSKCWDESSNSERADFTIIHVLMIVTSKPSAVSHAYLYWKLGPTMPNAPQLTSSAWKFLLLTTQLQLPKQGQGWVSCLICPPQTFRVSLCFRSSDHHDPVITKTKSNMYCKL